MKNIIAIIYYLMSLCFLSLGFADEETGERLYIICSLLWLFAGIVEMFF